MKNMVKLIGLIAIVAVIGFSIASCGGGDDGGPGPGPGPGGPGTTGPVGPGDDAYIPREVMKVLTPGWYDGAPDELTVSSHPATPFIYDENQTDAQKDTLFWNCVNNAVGKSGNTEYSATILLNRDVTSGFIQSLERNGLSKVKLYIIGQRGDEPGSWTIACDTRTRPGFKITEDVTLVLGDNITLVGRSDGKFPVVELTHKASYSSGYPGLIMKGTSIIQGNTNNGDSNESESDGSGGGVLISQPGTFIMEGGDIRNNKAREAGGGVCVYGKGKFIMLDGNIYGNQAACDGGVAVGPSGTGRFYIQGGWIAGTDNDRSSNKATGALGGGALWAGQYVHENVDQIGRFNKAKYSEEADVSLWWTQNPTQSFPGGKNTDIAVDSLISVWDGNNRY